MQVRMQLECEGGFHVVLRLEMHLDVCALSYSCPRLCANMAYIDKLVDILDVDLISANTTNEVHQPKLEGGSVGPRKERIFGVL